ncbi:uncharacterized protein LOC27206227 [Drosophila simulans]|uniref:Uncharacterized protein n=2 Tax=Drosophila simulans TaxID=7240 RepID=A0A0J9RV85_DROSI|nr:uncharacterized protein LOC27206227 [Drosophila simulans]KMY99608.1 uncharacterized protein Dsimw501_GD12610 [Drosophila simulans]
MMILQSEFTKIDDALDICVSMEEDLNECLNNVEAMIQKYNAPGRYTISMDPFVEDFQLSTSESTDLDRSSIGSGDSELDMLSQLYGARSAQELDESYVDVRYKFIKLKRSYEGAFAHFQRIVDSADRQHKISHRIFTNSQDSKGKLCRH